MVNKIFPFLWIVVNGNDVRFAKREASNVLREIDELLQRHAVRRSLVIRGQQFLLVVDLVDVLPTAAGKGLENGRPPDVVQQSIPIHRVFQVVQRFRSDIHAAWISLLREQNGLRSWELPFPKPFCSRKRDIHAAWISLLREQNGFGNGNSQLRSDRIIEI